MASKMRDINTLIAAGINPKNGLPYKCDDNDCQLKESIKQALSIYDKQDAINRYKWYNLPSGLTEELVERILYYRGQGMFFFSDVDSKFYFLPYCLDGTIDIYGRFKRTKALTFNGSVEEQRETIFSRDVVYTFDDIKPDSFINGCVLLSDYSKGISQTNIPRSTIQNNIINSMAEAYPFARTSLIANCGVKGMRVNDPDQAAQVDLASKSATKAALDGRPWIPIVGNIDFQDLTTNGSLNIGDYLTYIQSLDNLRLSLLGINNGGLFEKKAQVLSDEFGLNQSTSSIIYQDGLKLRQDFCTLVNAIWGIGIWCEASETMAGDTNLDGQVNDRKEFNNGGEQNDKPIKQSMDEDV